MKRIGACWATAIVFLLSGCGDDAAVDAGSGGSDAEVDASRRDAGASSGDAGDCATPDEDGDGDDAIACGGLDCDDADPARHSGAAEVCDDGDVDEDCDVRTFGARDGDSDGFIDGACCNDDGGMRFCGTDCDDFVPSVYDGAPEVCNARNDDCDEAIDEGVTASLCSDGDGDLHGEPGSSMIGCPGLVPGFVAACDDCDDGDASINPGVPDNTCDGVDNDCDLAVDDGHPMESCDGIDNDCDLVPDNGYDCVRDASETCTTSCGTTGRRTCRSDCTWPSCTPPGESCNGNDDDCDGSFDEGGGRVCRRGSVSATVNACGNGFLPCDVTCNSMCSASECVLGSRTWSFGANHSEVGHACGVASGWGPTSWESVGACADLAHGPVGAPIGLGWRYPPGNYNFNASMWCPDAGCTFRVTLFEVVRGTGLVLRSVVGVDVNDARTYPGRTVTIPHRVDTCDSTYWIQVDFNGPGLGVVHDIRVERTDSERLATWM